MARRFAETTTVPVDRTRSEIERVLTRYGASSFGYLTSQATKGASRAVIAFEAGKRHIKITMTLPAGETEKDRQTVRQRWRALLLVIKAKLESVESGIETLEEAFWANIVLPNGRTIYEETRQGVALAYEKGDVTKLLPDLRQ